MLPQCPCFSVHFRKNKEKIAGKSIVGHSPISIPSVPSARFLNSPSHSRNKARHIRPTAPRCAFQPRSEWMLLDVPGSSSDGQRGKVPKDLSVSHCPDSDTQPTMWYQRDHDWVKELETNFYIRSQRCQAEWYELYESKTKRLESNLPRLPAL